MKTLLLIDLQNDFFPGGALPVASALKILPAVQRLLDRSFDLVVATKDWHPASHASFAINHHRQAGEKILLDGIEQILWPVHCVQGEKGSEFHSGWDSSRVNEIVYKGTNPLIDSYSAFFDNSRDAKTKLDECLKRHGVTELHIAGLATDYCVKYSVLDALMLGYRVFLVADACAGVNVNATDSERAIAEMVKAGAIVVDSTQRHKGM